MTVPPRQRTRSTRPPTMGAELGTSVGDLSATLGTFFAAFAVGQLFIGPLSDRTGRKQLVLCGLAAFVAGREAALR